MIRPLLLFFLLWTFVGCDNEAPCWNLDPAPVRTPEPPPGPLGTT